MSSHVVRQVLDTHENLIVVWKSQGISSFPETGHPVIKGQLKRRDKLTSIARFLSPENGFEGIFEKFVLVLEILAVKVEELCGTNSRFSSFSEKILSGDFCM